MVVVIGLTIRTLHNRSLVAAAPDPSPHPAAPTGSAQTPSKPQPSLAERDPVEFKRFLHESEVIQDRSTSIRPLENRAYWRVLSWVEGQSVDCLKKRPFPDVSFNELVQHPAQRRGQLVRVELLVRRATSFEVADRTKQRRKLYELWGWPAASDGWLYVVVTPGLPPGFPTGETVEATVTAYGYFFKLQGYQPADAKPNARPLVAPLLVGRVSPVAVVTGSTPQYGLMAVVLIVGVAIVAVAVVGWFVAAKRTSGPRVPPSLPWPDPTDEVGND
jgi:hypothetical protein